MRKCKIWCVLTGMAASKQLTAAKAEAMGFLLPEVGLEAMGRLLEGVRLGSPHALSGSAGVAQSSYWRQLLQGMTSPPPFFADLPQPSAAPDSSAPASEVGRILHPHGCSHSAAKLQSIPGSLF